jgi:hypothetical protein
VLLTPPSQVGTWWAPSSTGNATANAAAGTSNATLVTRALVNITGYTGTLDQWGSLAPPTAADGSGGSHQRSAPVMLAAGQSILLRSFHCNFGGPSLFQAREAFVRREGSTIATNLARAVQQAVPCRSHVSCRVRMHAFPPLLH